MIDEDTIKKLDEWLEDEDRSSDTTRIDEQYSISSIDVDDFCDFLIENEPDLIGISCNVCGEGIWFSKNDLRNARHY